jgi:predicted RNase H-like HicB family nuclease
MLKYTVVLTQDPDDDAIMVTVPAMPGVLTWGATREEALASAREAIELHLEGYLERGRRFPADRPRDKPALVIEVKPPTRATRQSA